MRLLAITAVARPEGNRVDLSWTNPQPADFPGIRVLRREGTHPTGPADGDLVVDGIGLSSFPDVGLRGETVYYYGFFPYAGNPPVYDLDRHNRAAATVTSRYDFAGQLYAMLPSIYRRYDSVRGEDDGQLRRFLDLPGGELDRLYSLARTLLDASAVDRVDGALLPLLAQWIGWRTNHGLELDQQRNEIRFAPRIYQTIGGLDAVGATVARVTGWPSLTKEYVHNVARTNAPERLNLWSAVRDAAGVLGEPALASLNFAYDGRPVTVREADGAVSLIYHTHRAHGWDIWAKRWTAADGWEPSAPLVDRPGIDKHPSAALAGDKLWLFWQSYDPAERPGPPRWRISFAVRTGTTWSAPRVFGDDATERRMPAAVADATGGVWLFWRELAGGAWQLRWNRHDGTQWQLTTPATMPLDGAADPRIEDDLQVMFHPGAAAQPIWLFWTRQGTDGPPGQTRRDIAYRIKTDLNPAATAWSVVRTVPKTGGEPYHDRYPYPQVTGTGDVELVWSTTRGGGATIVRNVLARTPMTWGSAQTLVGGPFAGRAPAVASVGGGATLLIYRSNRSLPHDSGSLHTLDNRYAGTTTADTDGAAKLALRGTFTDFQTYVYDAGSARVRTNDDRIARDTVGLFLTPDVTDPDEIRASVARLAEAIREFMPVTTRAVFITS